MYEIEGGGSNLCWSLDKLEGGSFANSEGYGIYSPIELKINRTQTVRLCLTGRPDKALDNTKIGSVTVRLEGGY